MAEIIEASEATDLTMRATISAAHGREYVMDPEKAACALADFLAEYDHEQASGWTLGPRWFHDELRKLRAAATA